MYMVIQIKADTIKQEDSFIGKIEEIISKHNFAKKHTIFSDREYEKEGLIDRV